MLYREIIAVGSQIHTKYIVTLCGKNVDLLNVKLAVHIAATRLYSVKTHTAFECWNTGYSMSKTTFYSMYIINEGETNENF